MRFYYNFIHLKENQFIVMYFTIIMIVISNPIYPQNERIINLNATDYSNYDHAYKINDMFFRVAGRDNTIIFGDLPNKISSKTIFDSVTAISQSIQTNQYGDKIDIVSDRSSLLSTIIEWLIIFGLPASFFLITEIISLYKNECGFTKKVFTRGGLLLLITMSYWVIIIYIALTYSIWPKTTTLTIDNASDINYNIGIKNNNYVLKSKKHMKIKIEMGDYLLNISNLSKGEDLFYRIYMPRGINYIFNIDKLNSYNVSTGKYSKY
jgi:hypothetical protein